MKPIGEYNFREIVGKFVILQVDNPQIIDPNYDLFIAYCYIDMEAGISFSVYGGYKEEQIDIFKTKTIIIRYSENIKLKIYELITDEMKEYAENIENIYTPDWITSIRNNKDLDKVRSEQFPDDILVPCQTVVDDKQVGEYLWVRPIGISDDFLIAKSIEDGEKISKNEEFIVLIDPDRNDFSIIAVTSEWVELFDKENN